MGGVESNTHSNISQLKLLVVGFGEPVYLLGVKSLAPAPLPDLFIHVRIVLYAHHLAHVKGSVFPDDHGVLIGVLVFVKVLEIQHRLHARFESEAGECLPYDHIEALQHIGKNNCISVGMRVRVAAIEAKIATCRVIVSNSDQSEYVDT